MDDKLFLSVIVYLFISVSVASFLPNDFYTGSVYETPNEQEFKDISAEQIENVDSFRGQLNFFQKILTYLFVTWIITGMPTIVALFVLALNIFSIVIISVYVYDKLRGIG